MSQVPSPKSEEARNRANLRTVTATFLITALIAIAFQEAVTPVRQSLRSQGIFAGTSILFLVFFLTSVRFFIGNYLHMQVLAESRLSGSVWFYDLFWILGQTLVLVFMGGVCSIEESRIARVHFVSLLIGLYAIDVLWILSQWVMGLFINAWRRDNYPWGWAILNAAQVALLLGAHAFVFEDYYSAPMLWCLLGVSIGAFVFDVVLVDHSGLLK